MSRRRMTSALTVVLAVTLPQAASQAQFGGPRGGFGFGGSDEEVALVERHDRNGDGWLDRTERDAARAAMGDTSAAQGLRGGRRGGARPGAAGAGPALTPADVRPPYPRTPIYDLGTLRTIFLDFEGDDWERELESFYNTDVEVPARMTVDGRVYRDVGVRFRGASSYRMVPSGAKRSLNLSIDYVHERQDLGSYQTLNLLNANNDPTFLRTVLYTEIARRYIPAPKMNFMRVAINGESWGVYVNAQQFNGDFIREAYSESGGARWKAPGSPRGRAGLEYLGEDPAAYRRLYDIKTKDDEASWRALIEMTRVLNQTPPAQLEQALAPLLDIDEALKFMALEVALVNSDGYWSRASDYSLYRDTKGRFHVIPHDVNEAFGGEGGRGFGRGGPTLDPLVAAGDSSKPLYSKLLAVPALRQRYLGYVRDIAEKWLEWDAVYPVLKRSHDLIAADVRSDTRKLYDNAGFEAGIAGTGNPLKSFLDRRRAFLLEATAR